MYNMDNEGHLLWGWDGVDMDMGPRVGTYRFGNKDQRRVRPRPQGLPVREQVAGTPGHTQIGTNRELSISSECSTHYTTRTSRRTSSLSVTLYRVVYYRSQRESLGVCGVRGGCGARAVEGEQYDVPALW